MYTIRLEISEIVKNKKNQIFKNVQNRTERVKNERKRY